MLRENKFMLNGVALVALALLVLVKKGRLRIWLVALLSALAII